jgi:hypothetical protein
MLQKQSIRKVQRIVLSIQEAQEIPARQLILTHIKVGRSAALIRPKMIKVLPAAMVVPSVTTALVVLNPRLSLVHLLHAETMVSFWYNSMREYCNFSQRNFFQF